MLEFLKKQLDTLLEERGAFKSEMDQIVATAETEKRTALSEAEQSKFDELRSAITSKDAEIDAMTARIKDVQDDEARAAKVAEARAKYGTQTTAGTQVNEPDLYQRGGKNGNSYFRDLGKATITQDAAAIDRLRRNAQYEREQRALGNTGAVGGSGGEFAPPSWLIADWVNLIRAGRVTANLFPRQQVPAGVSSINYPKILTGTTTAIQSTQNSALSQTDLTTSYVQTGFATIGGKELVSQQLLDQTAVDFDRVVMEDLAADYGLRVGTQVYLGTGTGSGTGAVVNGLSNATIGSTQTWTQASPTPAGFYGQAGALLSKFLLARLLPPTCWVMSPRRWYWLASAVDGQGRPLVVPNGQAFNTMGTQSDPASPAGMVGTFHGLPVYVDPLVPINVGAGTNQDNVYLLRTDDLVLFESEPQVETFRETYADSLGVLFRMYAYVGTVLNRHPESIGVITGTGLVTPTFAS